MKTLKYYTIIDDDNKPIESQAMGGVSLMWSSKKEAKSTLAIGETGGDEECGYRVVPVTVHIP